MLYIQGLHQETELEQLINKYNDIYEKLFKWLFLKSPKRKYKNSRRGYVNEAAELQNIFRARILTEGIKTFEKIILETRNYDRLKDFAVVSPLLQFHSDVTAMFVKTKKHSNDNLYLFNLLRRTSTEKVLSGKTLAWFYEVTGFELLAYYLEDIEHTLFSIQNRGLVVDANGNLLLGTISTQLQVVEKVFYEDALLVGDYLQPAFFNLQDTVVKKFIFCQHLEKTCTEKYLS